MKHRLPFFKSEDEKVDINMTPMLDVVFIMLIFFIVTTSFIRESSVSIDRPKASTSIVLPQQAIIIEITDKNQIWIDHDRLIRDQYAVMLKGYYLKHQIVR
jgi:biopolymer transport protein ExbD